MMTETIANNLFKMVCFHISHNIKDMQPNALLSTLKVLSETTLDKSEISRDKIALMEEKVMEQYPKFISLDLATILSSFLRLSFIPREIIDEVNKMSQFSTFNKYSCLTILESLVAQKYNEKPELYDKLLN